jgi:hypothetical protein
MDDIPAATLHLVALGHYFTVFLCGILIKGLVLAIPEDDAFEEGTDLVLREVVGEFTHLVQQINILI